MPARKSYIELVWPLPRTPRHARGVSTAEGRVAISSPDQPDGSRATWVQTALTGIGAATIVTDAQGRVLFMNPVAESLTGWPQGEAAGRPVADVFRIENELTRRPVTDPVAEALATGEAVGLSNHIVLIARDGREWVLDDGAAPIRGTGGEVAGVVLVFRDVTDRRRAERAVEDARAFAEGIVRTVREPLLVLEADLRVRTANRSFYDTFRVDQADTVGRLLFDLGNGQWDIPRLRELLEQILPRDSHLDDFEVEHRFEGLGRRVMVLNARRLDATGGGPALILLAIEDETERRRAAESLALSEIRYRRLFETAQDGILLVDPDTRKVFDSNPFLTDLLGYSHDELVGKELWQIGLFSDIESNKAAFRTLQENGYIRYEDLPLRTHDGRAIEVEFVSNVYPVGAAQVIQCNIRDVTDRKRAEEALRAAHAGLEVRVQNRTSELHLTNGELKTEIARREVAEADRRDFQQRLTTAQEDERRRIARELHDQMGQHLAALGIGLKVIEGEIPDPSPARDRLRSLRALTDLIGREIHTLALELRPTALDDLGLQAALANYAERWAERSGVEIDFQSAGLDDVRLPPLVETALYRIVQEALANTRKHASARHVSVVLQRAAGHVTAVVEDDGRGFDTESAPSGDHRLGILGMRERATLAGGSLSVESEPGRGTTVIARIPLPPQVTRGADGHG